MEWLAWIGIGLFCASSLVVGGRLVLLWGLGLACLGLVSVVDSTAKLRVDHAMRHPGLLILDALSGALAACSLYFAFIPRDPLAWLRRPQTAPERG